MTMKMISPLAVFLLAACSGNSLNNVAVATTPPLATPTTPPAATTSAVPEVLKFNIVSAAFVPNADPALSTLNIAIASLDTTPVVATWARRPSMDVAGFTAFAVQEDALDRLFVGLAGQSNDGSVRAVLAGDGGQFNKFFSGTVYERTGAFTPPAATGSGPTTGQVSYSGNYVGQLNGGGNGAELLPSNPATDVSARPREAARITGQGFVNANFADMSVNGTIFNRLVINASPGIPFNLKSIVLIPSTILADGTVTGNVEEYGVVGTKIGDFGGIFGGTDASSFAGGISLTKVVDGAGDTIDDALERGIFVLNQCTVGTAGCSAVAVP